MHGRLMYTFELICLGINLVQVTLKKLNMECFRFEGTIVYYSFLFKIGSVSIKSR